MTSRDRDDNGRAIDPALRDQDLRETVEDLRDAETRVVTLEVLVQRPLRDERVIPHLRALLADTTSCVMFVPFRYGEVRWLAAHALADEYEALGIDETVHLSDVLVPLQAERVHEIARESGVSNETLWRADVLDVYESLRKPGLLPTKDLLLPPP